MKNISQVLRFINHSPLILWSIGCILIISAYWPSLAGPLVFDDQLNIVENPGVAIHDLSFASLKRAALSNESGHLKRILPALSFGINHYFAGGFDNTLVFKATNLAIHLINSALAFWLCYLLWPRCRALLRGGGDIVPASVSTALLPAAFAALVWALHPLQVNAVVYVVQRMTSLSATCVLLGLAIFLLGRQRFAEQHRNGLPLMAGGIIGGTLLGLLCKENAALLVLYAGVIEWTLFSGDALSGGQKRRLTYFYALLLALPLCAGLVYLFVYPGGIWNGYAGRPFTLAERLLTQARVLWFYLYLLFVPDITAMGLFHDDIPVSSGWLSPWTTLPSVVAWALLAPLALLLRKTNPAVAFAIFWYLAGHSMESTIIPLEMVFEHRNYLPSLGPILLFCALGDELLDWISCRARRARLCRTLTNAPKPGRAPRALQWLYYFTVIKPPQHAKAIIKSALAVGILFGLYWGTLAQAVYWRSEDGFIASQAINHPYSPSCQYLYGEVLYKKRRDPLAAYPFYFRAAQLKPQEAGFLISLHMVTPVATQSELQKRHLTELLDPNYITRLLQEQPVSAWGMRALDVAGRCVVAKYELCKEHLTDMRNWLRAFDRNPLADRQTRRHFVNVLFDIEMGYGFYAAALQTVQNAKAGDPGFLRYTLMHADALAATKRYREALQLLAAAQQQWRDDNDALRNIAQLRKAIATLANGGPRS